MVSFFAFVIPIIVFFCPLFTERCGCTCIVLCWMAENPSGTPKLLATLEMFYTAQGYIRPITVIHIWWNILVVVLALLLSLSLLLLLVLLLLLLLLLTTGACLQTYTKRKLRTN